MLYEMEIKKLEWLELDFNFLENPIQICQRLSWANATNNSQNYNRVEIQCYYAVSKQQ